MLTSGSWTNGDGVKKYSEAHPSSDQRLDGKFDTLSVKWIALERQSSGIHGININSCTSKLRISTGSNLNVTVICLDIVCTEMHSDSYIFDQPCQLKTTTRRK